MKTTTTKWLEKAKYDQETARAMLASNRYLYVLFCCQQSVEKTLKALIVEKSEELPPRIHNLPRLVQVCNLTLDEHKMDFLARLSAFYIECRYPADIEEIGAEIDREKAEAAFHATEEILQWLFSMLE